jgi:hypothetical protein
MLRGKDEDDVEGIVAPRGPEVDIEGLREGEGLE